MAIDVTTTRKNGYSLLELHGDLSINSDISPLAALVDETLASGARNIALRFTRDSYLSTRTIAVLVNCFENIRDAGGNLAVIAPNEDIIDVLGMIDLNRVVRFCSSEDELSFIEAPVNALA